MTNRKKCENRNEIGDCLWLHIPCDEVCESDCRIILSKYGNPDELKKVVKGMEFCSQIAGCRKECPYHDDGCGTCMVSLRRDALKALKRLAKLWELELTKTGE